MSPNQCRILVLNKVDLLLKDFIFCSFQVFFASYMTQIVFMPLFSKFITQIGSRRLFISGLLLSGICNISFSGLKHADNPQLFFGMSLLILAFSAIGYSAIFSSVYPLATGVSAIHITSFKFLCIPVLLPVSF